MHCARGQVSGDSQERSLNSKRRFAIQAPSRASLQRHVIWTDRNIPEYRSCSSYCSSDPEQQGLVPSCCFLSDLEVDHRLHDDADAIWRRGAAVFQSGHSQGQSMFAEAVQQRHLLLSRTLLSAKASETSWRCRKPCFPEASEQDRSLCHGLNHQNKISLLCQQRSIAGAFLREQVLAMSKRRRREPCPKPQTRRKSEDYSELPWYWPRLGHRSIWQQQEVARLAL